jgi:hypothetical protein
MSHLLTTSMHAHRCGNTCRVGAGPSREHRTQREVPWRALTPEQATFCAFRICVSSHNNAKRLAPRPFSPQTQRKNSRPKPHEPSPNFFPMEVENAWEGTYELAAKGRVA